IHWAVDGRQGWRGRGRRRPFLPLLSLLLQVREQVRVADGSLLRLIGKCLHVGVLDGADYSEPDLGTAQGSVLSPLRSSRRSISRSSVRTSLSRRSIVSLDSFFPRISCHLCTAMASPLPYRRSSAREGPTDRRAAGLDRAHRVPPTAAGAGAS